MAKQKEKGKSTQLKRKQFRCCPTIRNEKLLNFCTEFPTKAIVSLEKSFKKKNT